MKLVQRDLLYYLLFNLELRSNAGRDDIVYVEFFHLLTFEGHSMSKMRSYYLNETWQELDAEEDLSWSIKNPEEKI